MELVDVSSSNLQSVGWQAGTLRILFHSGSAYDYMAVPVEVFTQLMIAESKNEFFLAHVKDVFKYEKVNLTKERKTMKKQSAAAAKTVTPAVQPQPAPAPTPVAPVVAPAPATPSKQQVTVDKL